MAAFTVIDYTGEGMLQQQGGDKRKHVPIAPASAGVNGAIGVLADRSKRKGSPQQAVPPVAVARRNARERNRVKQVNNGFAVLRQHIPTTLAQDGDNNRNKKLSKVETLRMAVEYIRKLEDLLTFSTSSTTSSQMDEYSYSTQIKTENMDQQFGSFEDEENLQLELDMEMAMGLEEEMSFMDGVHSRVSGSLSPGLASSDHSLSPRNSLGAERDGKLFLAEFSGEDLRLKYSLLARAEEAHNLLHIPASWFAQNHINS